MALLWMDADGNGISVVETAAEARRRIEDDEEDAKKYVEFLIDTGGEEEPYRTIFIDKECIWAIEQGPGVRE